MAAVYLQVSIISQALIFVTRSKTFSWLELPGLLLVDAFIAAQLLATIIAVYASWSFARIKGCGWGWAGIIWAYSVVTYIPLDFLKYLSRYILSGKAWGKLHNKTAFTEKRDFGKGERGAEWAQNQRTIHGLKTVEPPLPSQQQSTYGELSEIAEQARRRAELARLRELHTSKGKIEAVVKRQGLDIDNVPQHYTL